MAPLSTEQGRYIKVQRKNSRKGIGEIRMDFFFNENTFERGNLKRQPQAAGETKERTGRDGVARRLERESSSQSPYQNMERQGLPGKDQVEAHGGRKLQTAEGPPVGRKNRRGGERANPVKKKRKQSQQHTRGKENLG